MTTFRQYREAMAAGAEPALELPKLPSDAVAFQGDRAGFVSRALGASIDVAIIFVVVLGSVAVWWGASFLVEPINSSDPLAGTGDRVPDLAFWVVYGYVLNVLYWTIGWATGGRTVGNLIMGLRVVNHRGERMRWAGAFVRALFCTLFIPGLFWVIVSGANRSVQDVVLRTSVIYDWVIGIPGLSRKAGSPRPPEPASGRSA